VLAVPLVMAAFGAKSYRVMGEAMAPAYSEGDIVYVKSAANYRVGNVVQLRQDGEFIRRIVAVDSAGFATCADSLCPKSSDDSTSAADDENGSTGVEIKDRSGAIGPVGTETVSREAIVGRVVARFGGWSATVLGMSATWPGRMVSALVCVLLLWPWGARRARRGRAVRGAAPRETPS
jgi:hypothetical protein